MARIAKLIRPPFFPVVLAPIILFAPVLFTGEALYWGTTYLQFVPWRSLAFDMLKSGVLPLWNPMVGMGAPLLANYQSAFFYPTTWLLWGIEAIGGVPWLAWGQTIVVIFHLIFSGLGMIFLCRKLRLDVIAQSVAGLAFCLCGYLVARAGFLSINAAVAWLPWIILAGSQIAGPQTEIRTSSKKLNFITVFPLMACVTLQLLAGHAQTSYYTLLLLVAWVAFWGYRAGKFKGLFVAIGYTAFAIFGALSISAVQILPTAEYLLQSQRASSVSFDVAMNYSFLPWRLLTLIAPILFGTPAQGSYMLYSDNYWEDAVYIGLIPLLLAIGGIWKGIKRSSGPETSDAFTNKSQKSLVLFLLITIVISFLLALGKNSPVFPFLYRFVPTFDLFQAPTRFTILAEFALVLLAAIGANGWHRPEGRARAWTRRGIAISIAILIGSVGGLFVLTGGSIIFTRAVALAGGIGLIAGVLNLALPEDHSKRKQAWVYAVITVIALDLFIADWGLNPGISLDAYRFLESNPGPLTSLQAGERIYLDYKSENSLMYDQFFRFNDFTNPIDLTFLKTAMLPDASILAGVPSANNFDPLVPDRYSRWMDYLASATPEVQARMFALMDVGLVETYHEGSSEGLSFTPYESQKVSWSNCAILVENEEEAWKQTTTLVSSDVESVTGSIILETAAGGGDPVCDQTLQAAVTGINESADRTVISLTSPAKGWMMVANTWYPGWVATVDGKETSILHADSLFMAVEVPQGQHTIELVYRPNSFYLGAAISGLAFLLASLVSIVFIRKNVR